MKKTLLLIGLFISVALFSVPAQAANVTWTNNSTSNWTNNSNWSGSAVPTASDDVSIPISLGAGNYTYVQISAAGAVANSVTLAPTGSATNAGAILVLDASSSASLTTGSLSVGGSSGNEAALQYNAAGTVTVTGSSMDLGAGSSATTLNFGAPGTLTVGGGTGSITKSGNGTLNILVRTITAPTINAANVTATYLGVGDNSAAGGTFNINSGQTYNVTNTFLNNVGSGNGTSTLTINGGTLNQSNLWFNNGGTTTGVVNLNNGGTISASNLHRLLAGASQTFNWNDGTITNKAGSDLTLSSAAGGANNLVLSLAGTGNHTFNAASGRTITVASTATLADQSGQNGTLTKTGAGTLVLSGSNTYSGATTISGGTLTLGNSTALQNSALDTANSVAGNATAGLKTTVSTLTLGGLTGNKNLASVFTTASGGYSGVTALTLNPGTGATNAYSGNITDGAANMTLTKNGAGIQTLSGSNSYTGATTVNAGTLVFGNTSAKAAGNVTATAAATVGLGVGAGSGDYSDANVAALFNTTLAGFSLDPASGVAVDTTAGNFTQQTALTATRALTKLGTNTLTLTGANSYNGGTTVAAGTLALSGNGTFGTGTLTVSAVGTADLGAKSITNTLGALTGGAVNNGTITNNSSTYDLQNGSVGAVLAGTNGAAKTTANTVTLSGSNSYTGGTAINGGTLQANHANALGTSGNITFGGGALQYTSASAGQDWATRFKNSASAIGLDTNGQTVTLAGVVDSSNTGGLTKLGAGTLALNVANTYTGGTALNAGTLRIGNASALSSGAATFTGNATLQAGGAYTVANAVAINSGITGTVDTNGNNATFSGNLTGSGSLVKIGNGTLTLTGGYGNTLTGAIFVNAGKLGTAPPSGNINSFKNVTGNVTVASGATFGADARFDSAAFTNNFFISGTGIGGTGTAYQGALHISSNTKLAGTITLNADSTISHDFNFAQIDGPITGTNKNLTLRNLYSGQPGFVIAGNITLGTGSLTVYGVTDSADGQYYDGSAKLSGTNSYTGGTFVNSGVLSIDKTASLPGWNTANYTVASGATLAVTNLISDADAATILSTGNFSVGAFGFNTFTGNRTYASTISDSATVVNLAKFGKDTLTLSANNTFSGTTTIYTGVLSVNSLSLQNSTLDTANSIAGSATAGLQTASTTLTLGGLTGNKNLASVFTTSGNYSTLTALTLNPGTGISNTYSGNITDGAAGMTLTKTGNGTQALSGSNSYTGGTAINGGTLQANHANALGTSGNITFGGGTLQYTSASAGQDWATRFKNSASAIGLDTNSQAVTLAGVIDSSNTGGLTKLGAGTLVLDNSNTYTGATAVNSGTLQIGSNGTTGALANSSNITVASGATLAYNRTDSYGGSNITNKITGNGTLAVNSSTLYLKNIANNIGSTIVVAGATDAGLQINSSGAGFTTGTLTVGGNGSGTSFFALNTDQTINAGSINLAAGTGNATLTLGVGALTVGGGTGSITHGGSGFSSIKVTGTVPLNAASVAANQVIIGDNNPGNLTISSGQTYNLTSSLFISNSAGNTGQNATLNLTGGSVTTPTVGILVGTSGNAMNAIVNLSGGTLFTGGINRAFNGNSLAFNWNDGTIQNQAGADLNLTSQASQNLVISLASTGNHTFNADSGRTITVASTATLADKSGQNGTLTKAGLGTLVLNGNNTYSGGTTLTSGTLVLAHNSAAGTAGITVSGSSTLQINSLNTIVNNIVFSNASAAINRQVAASGSYNVGTSGNLTSSLGGTNTTAKILAGTNSALTTDTITMSFRNTSGASNDLVRLSDVFSLSGMTIVSGSKTDQFVLQLNASTVTSTSIIGWFDSGSNTWVNAVSGNTGGTPNFVLGAYTNQALGSYGVDVTNHNVWAVLNHNSDFAVIPEPTTWALLAFSLTTVMVLRRRRNS